MLFSSPHKSTIFINFLSTLFLVAAKLKLLLQLLNIKSSLKSSILAIPTNIKKLLDILYYILVSIVMGYFLLNKQLNSNLNYWHPSFFSSSSSLYPEVLYRYTRSPVAVLMFRLNSLRRRLTMSFTLFGLFSMITMSSSCCCVT